MPTETLTLSYKETVTPKGGKYISSGAHTLEFRGELELEGSDRAIAKQIEDAFKKLMKEQVSKQLKFLGEWLKSADAQVVKFMKDWQDLLKIGFPATVAAARDYERKLDKLSDLESEIAAFERHYASYVDDWARNCAEQQGLIAMQLAIKKARVDVRRAKKTRVWLGKIVKGTLIVAGVALGVAGIVASGGAAAPVFLALAIAGTTLSGGSALVGLGKTIKENADQEKRLLKNVQKDMETVKEALQPLPRAKSNIAKHVTELQNLIRVRQDKVKALKNELQKCQAQLKGYQKDLDKARSAPAIAAKEVKKREKAVDSANGKVRSIQGKISRLEADNRNALATIREMEALVGDIDKLSAQAPNSILGNLKAQYSSLDGWLEAVDDVGGLLGDVSGLG